VQLYRVGNTGTEPTTSCSSTFLALSFLTLTFLKLLTVFNLLLAIFARFSIIASKRILSLMD
jgi:hypothetical protein